MKTSLFFRIAGEVLLVVLFQLGGMRGYGQATAGSQISGVVTDPAGAVVPGAQVKATQTATGLTRTTVSDSRGTYVLPNLSVGPYELRASAAGFKTYIQKGILLEVNSKVSVNIALQLGAVTQNVEVSANAKMVQTSSNAVSQVIGEHRVVQLPLNGRDPIELVVLSGAGCAT